MPVVRSLVTSALTLAVGLLAAVPALAQEHRPGGEANLILPDLNSAQFLGVGGHTLLLVGLVVSVLGLLFGLVIYAQLKKHAGPQVHARSLRADLRDLQDVPDPAGQVPDDPVALHRRDHAAVLRLARSHDRPGTGADVYGFPPLKVAIILLFSLVGIAGCYGVAWFGIRVNTFANSRTAFAALRGKPFPCYAIPLKAGMSIGMALISVELLIMLVILLFVPGDYAGRLLHRLRHRRVARRRGPAHRRRHLHQDRRHRLGPDEDRLQDQGRRRPQPRRDRRLRGRQRRRLGRPLAPTASRPTA